jgi:long-chain acyl-CoA synthetase
VHILLWLTVSVLVLTAGYAVFVAVTLGLHQRLPLAFRGISIEAIPDRAARYYGKRILFTSDKPCAWEIPFLRERYPDAKSWSAVRIQQTAGILATMLRERLGMQSRDRAAILKQNHIDIHIFAAGVVRGGGIACPINGKFPTADLRLYLEKIGATILISDTLTIGRVGRECGVFSGIKTIVLAEKRQTEAGPRDIEAFLQATNPQIQVRWLEELLADVYEVSAAVPRAKDDIIYLVHSSGTTGFPKAVVLKNGRQSHAVRGWLCYVHISRHRDKGYLAVPNNHQAILLTFNGLLLVGAAVHWTGGYDHDDFAPETTIKELADGRFTGFFGFPVTFTQLKEVALENYDLSRIRFWVSTADASHEVIQRRFVAFGGAFRRAGWPRTGSIYMDAQGSSEVGTPSVLRYITPSTKTFGRRIGRPGSTPFGPKTRVVTDTGEMAARGQAGRLEVKGKTVFDGYWKDDALTKSVIRKNWFFTGDIVRHGTDGHIVQLDREVDVIHTAHGPVYTLPMEEKIHRHPAVFDACVYGARHDDGTQRPATAIALRQGFTVSRDELKCELNAMLGQEEQLERVDVIGWDEFPIGVTGKTLKRVFRERTEP